MRMQRNILNTNNNLALSRIEALPKAHNPQCEEQIVALQPDFVPTTAFSMALIVETPHQRQALLSTTESEHEAVPITVAQARSVSPLPSRDVTILSDCSLPTFKNQVDDDIMSLPVATATALDDVHRACIRQVVRERHACSVSNFSIVEEAEEQLLLETHQARLRFQEAERKLKELQRLKRERSVVVASVLPQPRRQSVMDMELAEQIQSQIWDEEERERDVDMKLAEKIQSQIWDEEERERNRSMAEKLQREETFSSTPHENSVLRPTTKKRRHLQELSENHTTTLIVTKEVPLRKNPLLKKSEELWV